MGHIFISYSHKDSSYVHKLVDALEEEGFEVWIDDRIDYGSEWPKVVTRNLDVSDGVVIVMSNDSFESDMVQNEITRAREKKKPIFPLLLEGDNWLIVQAKQFVDVRDESIPTEKFYKRLEEITQRKSKKVERDAAERIAQEKTAREKAERDVAKKARLEEAEEQTRQKAAREKAERDAAEKALLKEQAKQKIASKKTERENVEKPLIDKTAREPHKEFSKIISGGQRNPRTLLSWMGVIVIAVVCVSLGIFGVSKLLPLYLPGALPAVTQTQSSASSPEAFIPTSNTTSSGFECPQPEYPIDITSTELNLFIWTEYVPPEMLECFELVYGVKVNRDEYSSNEEMYAILSAGGNTYDLVLPTDYIIEPMIRRGLLQELDHGKLPVITNLDSNYLNLSFDLNNRYTLPYQAGADAIVVHTDKVANVPQSWADLWEPEYAGRIVLLDDSRAIIGVTLLTLGYDVNTTDPSQLEEAKNKLAELIPNVKVFDSDSSKTALIAGDVDLGVVWTQEAFFAQQENSVFKFVYPTEGAILWQDNWAIPANAPHVDVAYAWLNYTMQGNVFWTTLRDFPFTNPNLAAIEYVKNNYPSLYNTYVNSNVLNIPADVIRSGHRIADVGEALPLYDQIWVEVKGQ